MRYVLQKAGPFIGPRGGKWADPKHTIPWKEKTKTALPREHKSRMKESLDRARRGLVAWEKQRVDEPTRFANIDSKELLARQRRFAAQRKSAKEDQRVGDFEKWDKRFKEAAKELESRREYYTRMREIVALEEGLRTGKLTLGEGEVSELLGNPGDVYRDHKWRGEYNPDLFIVSDLSGRKIRHYVKLPDGRIGHPDEIHEARKRGRIVTGDVKVPTRDWGEIGKSACADDLEKAGPFIGPRGGKWADPKHTIPWKEKTTKRKRAAAKEKRVDVWGTKLTPAMVEQFRKDMRNLSKLYRSIDIPTASAPEGSHEKWLGQYGEAHDAFRTFAKNLREWSRDRLLESKDESYSARMVREKFWRVGDDLEKMFPTSWNYKTDKYEPSSSRMRETGSAALRRMQGRVRDSLKEAERFLADKGGEIEREPVFTKFNVGPVQYVMHGRGLTEEGKEKIAKTLRSVGRAHSQLKEVGLGEALSGLSVHIHDESPKTVGESFNVSAGALTAGWYNRANDRLRLFPLGHDDNHEVLIHELGHRVYYKLMTERGRQSWQRAFEGSRIEKKREHIDQFIDRFAAGNTYDVGGAPFVDHDKVKAAVNKDTSELGPVWRSFAQHMPVYKEARTPEGMRAHYRKFFEEGEHVDREFITEYAATNPEEAFAEAFQLYVLKGPRAVPPWTRQQLRESLASAGVPLRKSEDAGGLEKAGLKHTIPRNAAPKKPKLLLKEKLAAEGNSIGGVSKQNLLHKALCFVMGLDRL